ncbi:MAG: hypothetical protein E6Q97_31270 [Desulfurellales bacterium]|nr:MAG: hypothetical protein E6Q97_31270 [Desulfurellales bacterium]
MSTMRLRQWQAECEAAYAGHQHQTFLVAALPGAGKTIGAGVIARRQFLQRYPRGIVVLIVPTDHMRSQWRSVMSRVFGIELTEEVTGRLPSGFHGVVTTYAGAAKRKAKLGQLVRSFPTLAILDEVHHAGDKASWGSSLVEALGPARSILALSGTPFRHDETTIPFLRLAEAEDGSRSYITDYSYDFAQALRDKVVRSVSFETFDALARYLDKGFTKAEFLAECSERDTATVLKILLNDEGFLEKTLRAADIKLSEIRSRIPSAGGLAIAIDTDHAKLVASVLERITGTAPDIVVSDETSATSSIAAFSSDHRRRWIVAVRMVSEGVDIPRLMVMAMLTNVTTRLYFRQAVGRVVRRQGEHDPLAHVYMPASRHLVQHAHEIERLCSDAADPEEDGEAEDQEDGLGGGRPQREITVLSVTDAQHKSTLFRGLDDALSLDLPLPPQEAALPSLEERMLAARSEIQVLVAKYARMTGVTPHIVHREYMMKVRRTPQARMSLAQLNEKADYYRRRIAGVSSARVDTQSETSNVL